MITEQQNFNELIPAVMLMECYILFENKSINFTENRSENKTVN